MPSPTSEFSAEPDSASSSLLARLRCGDDEAWRRMVRLYSPLVYRWCRQCDLQPSDAADVMQEVFRNVAASIDTFERRVAGAFRGWLWTITRNRIRDHLRRRRVRPDAPGGSALQRRLLELAEGSEEETFFGSQPDDEVQRHRQLHRALEMIRADFDEHTWTSFWRMTVDGQTAGEIADALGMTKPAVRQAKYRVLRRLRRELEDFL